MALTQAVSVKGFEWEREVVQGEVMYVPGDPGVTFTEGDLVIPSVGVAVLCTDSANTMVGRVEKTVVCPAASQAFPAPGQVYPPGDTAAMKTLIPIRPLVPVGTPVLKATFAGHQDETVVSYTESTRAIACTTGFGADNRPNGAFVYVYDGPGKGEINVVESYDHSGGAAALLLVCHRPFNATLTSDSKFIVLSQTSGAVAQGFFGRLDADAMGDGKLDLTDGQDDGDFTIFGDFRKMPAYLDNLTLPVIRSSMLFSAA